MELVQSPALGTVLRTRRGDCRQRARVGGSLWLPYGVAEASVTRGFITDEQPALWLLQNELLALVSVPEVEVWL